MVASSNPDFSKDDFICSICHEVVKDPVIPKIHWIWSYFLYKTSCNHIFCNQCLEGYKASLISGNVRNFHCPFCRFKFTSISGNDEVINIFKKNLNIWLQQRYNITLDDFYSHSRYSDPTYENIIFWVDNKDFDEAEKMIYFLSADQKPKAYKILAQGYKIDKKYDELEGVLDKLSKMDKTEFVFFLKDEYFRLNLFDKLFYLIDLHKLPLAKFSLDEIEKLALFLINNENSKDPEYEKAYLYTKNYLSEDVKKFNQVIISLAECYYNLGNKDRALDLLFELKKTDLNETDLLFKIISDLINDKNDSKINEIIVQFSDDNRKFNQVISFLAERYYNLGNKDRALDLLFKLKDIELNDNDLFLKIISDLLDEGKGDKINEIFMKMEINSNSPSSTSNRSPSLLCISSSTKPTSSHVPKKDGFLKSLWKKITHK